MAADQNPTPWTVPAPREAVLASAGGTYFSVAPCRPVAGTLPADVLAEYAPPLAVCTGIPPAPRVTGRHPGNG